MGRYPDQRRRAVHTAATRGRGVDGEAQNRADLNRGRNGAPSPPLTTPTHPPPDRRVDSTAAVHQFTASRSLEARSIPAVRDGGSTRGICGLMRPTVRSRASLILSNPGNPLAHPFPPAGFSAPVSRYPARRIGALWGGRNGGGSRLHHQMRLRRRGRSAACAIGSAAGISNGASSRVPERPGGTPSYHWHHTAAPVVRFPAVEGLHVQAGAPDLSCRPEGTRRGGGRCPAPGQPGHRRNRPIRGMARRHPGLPAQSRRAVAAQAVWGPCRGAPCLPARIGVGGGCRSPGPRGHPGLRIGGGGTRIESQNLQAKRTVHPTSPLVPPR